VAAGAAGAPVVGAHAKARAKAKARSPAAVAKAKAKAAVLKDAKKQAPAVLQVAGLTDRIRDLDRQRRELAIARKKAIRQERGIEAKAMMLPPDRLREIAEWREATDLAASAAAEAAAGEVGVAGGVAVAEAELGDPAVAGDAAAAEVAAVPEVEFGAEVDDELLGEVP
jgi:hypothetical protein